MNLEELLNNRPFRNFKYYLRQSIEDIGGSGMETRARLANSLFFGVPVLQERKNYIKDYAKISRRRL